MGETEHEQRQLQKTYALGRQLVESMEAFVGSPSDAAIAITALEVATATMLTHFRVPVEMFTDKVRELMTIMQQQEARRG